MKTRHLLQTAALAAALAFSLQPPAWVFASPLGTVFNYQGNLAEGGLPAQGIYDFRFAIYDSDSGGTALAGPLTNAVVTVSNGLFTAILEFGAVFDGNARWLEIGVRASGTGDFTVLVPRQALAPTPYALYAPSAGTAAAAGTATTAATVTGNVSATQLTGAISPNNIAAGTITSAMLANGAVTTAALADGAVATSKLATVPAVTLLTAFTNPTPAANEFFGFSVAGVGSDHVLIGALSAGAAYLFSLNGALLTTFTNPSPVGAGGIGCSVAGVGSDRVLIGADYDSTGGEAAGAAYLFSTNGTLLTTFTNPTPVPSDEFGNSVAGVGSDRVLIGAPYDDMGSINAGAAYLFNTNGTLLTTFTNPSPAYNDLFGYSVAVVGNDGVLLDAPSDDTGGANAGAVYLFSSNGTLLTTFTNPTPAAGDGFGIALAAVGSDRVLIGAWSDNTGAADTGAAYLFGTNGTLLTTFTNPTPAAGDGFGYSVAAVGSDRVLIHAPWDDAGALDTGTVYLFSTNGALLITLTNPTPEAGDAFGIALAAVGSDRVLIGAWSDNTGATDTGAAYLFSLCFFAPGLVADGVRSGAITTASLADGAVTAAKFALGAVTSTAIADGTITDADINPSGINAGKIIGGDLRALRLQVGWAHTLLGDSATIAGGAGHTVAANASLAAIGGGQNNRIESTQSTIGGGGGNVISNYGGFNTISGGTENTIAEGTWSTTIAGGQQNTARPGANYSTIAGGISNVVGGWHAFAAGYNAKANHAGSFVWADSTEADFASTGNNQFLIRASGGVGIGTAIPSTALDVAGTVKATGFTGSGAGLTGISGAALADGSVAGSKLAPGDVGLTSLNTASVDTRYVKKAGDTMTGTLAVPANGLQAGGSQLVLASGYVGIGEVSPGERLVVGQGGNIALKASADDAGDIVFQTSAGTQKGRVYTAPAAGQNKLHLSSGDNNPDVTIGTNGYVGIATENPQSALHVNGSLQLDKTGPELGRLILNTVSRNDPGRYGILFSNNLQAPFLGDNTQPIAFSFMSGWSNYRTNDATVRVHGKASGTWGNCLGLTHNGTSGLITTDVGDLVLAPSGNVGIGTSGPQAKLDVSGDLKVSGAYKGTIGPNGGAPFPRPAYDSGWVSIAEGESETLTHNIGGNVDNYVVDMQFRYGSGSPHQRHYGGYYWFYYEEGNVPVWSDQGAWWSGLTSSSISVFRESMALDVERIRIRIWVYN